MPPLPPRSPQGAPAVSQPRRELGSSRQPPGRASSTVERAIWPLRRGVRVRCTAYEGPLSSAAGPDAHGRPRARHGAASFQGPPGWI